MKANNLSALLLFVFLLAAWWACAYWGFLPPSLLPSPQQVFLALVQEVQAGRLFNDVVASLFRVLLGFLLALISGVPLGLCLGNYQALASTLLPLVNFLRNLSTLAWIPFAVIWFGVGDAPVIFLIFMGAVFPLALATMSAVHHIPKVYLQVAQEYGFQKRQLLFSVILPAITPQLLTTMRMVMGISWVVMVAGEMLAGEEGMGFAIFDARNGMRVDLLVAEMLIIGFWGIVFDWALVKLKTMPRVRWGYEQ